MDGNADSKQIKTPARVWPKGISEYFVPAVKLPTSGAITFDPGSQRGNGTYSPNGIRRILSYCAMSRPSSFTSAAELYQPLSGAGSCELKSIAVWFSLAKRVTRSRNSESPAYLKFIGDSGQ